MPYCKAGEKGTVIYKFPKKKQETYTSKDCPLEVTVRQTKESGYVPGVGYVAEYDVDFGGNIYSYRDYGASSSNTTLINPKTRIIYYPISYPEIIWGRETGFSQLCRKFFYVYRVYFYNSSGVKTYAHLNLGGFHERAGNPIPACRPEFLLLDFWLVRANQTKDPLTWEIVIKTKSGQVFKDYGEGEPAFRVECGDCPAGTIKCKASGYPGYCCIPCKDIAQRINKLAARI